MSAVVIFGIPNCDTVKKARDWLDKRNIDYQFHDFRRDGLTNKQIKSWLTQVDVEILLNKRSRTFLVYQIAIPSKKHGIGLINVILITNFMIFAVMA
jgi:arsenate reductase